MDFKESSVRDKGGGGRLSGERGTAGVKTLREENEVASRRTCLGVKNPKIRLKN